MLAKQNNALTRSESDTLPETIGDKRCLAAKSDSGRNFSITLLEERDPEDEGNRPFVPVQAVTASLGQLIEVARDFAWSPIQWNRGPSGGWRRRKSAFKASSLFFADLDGHGWDAIPALVSSLEERDLRGFLLAGRRDGNFTLVLETETSMDSEPVHRMTYLHHAKSFSADLACCDAVDFLNPRRVLNNPRSGELVWQNLDGQFVLPVIMPSTAAATASKQMEDKEETRPFSPILSIPGTNTDLIKIKEFLSACSPASSKSNGGHGQNRAAFRLMVSAGKMLHSIGRLELLADLVMQHLAPRCSPPLMQDFVEGAVVSIREYAKSWRISPVQRKQRGPTDWVKTPTMPCACGCGKAVPQVQGKGRPKKWFSQACKKRHQRRSQKAP